MSRVKAASSPASPPLTSGSVGVMVEKRRYRSDRYRLIPVSAVYTRGERLHKIRDRPLSSSMTRRLVTRHVWQDDLEQADMFTKTLNGKRIYAWRKQTIERSFAEAKELHGLRYARMLGIRNMYEQSFLTAAVQNMKRIVKAIFSCFISLLYAKTPYPLLKTWRFSAV